MRVLPALLVFFSVFCVCVVSSADNSTISADPRLAPAKESYEQALYYIRKGDKAFRSRPGLAQKMYEHAESYLNKAVFLYKRSGRDNGIDVEGDVAECQDLFRQVHVKTGKARKKARGR